MNGNGKVEWFVESQSETEHRVVWTDGVIAMVHGPATAATEVAIGRAAYRWINVSSQDFGRAVSHLNDAVAMVESAAKRGHDALRVLDRVTAQAKAER